MLLLGAMFRNLPVSLNTLVGNFVRPFAWPEYVLGGIIYSFIVFAGQLPGPMKIGPRVFSRQNVRPLPAIIAAHTVFLTVFLGCMGLASSHPSRLLTWMTAKALINPGRHGGANISLLDLLLVLLAVLLRTIELPCIYAPARSSGPVTYERP